TRAGGCALLQRWNVRRRRCASYRGAAGSPLWLALCVFDLRRIWLGLACVVVRCLTSTLSSSGGKQDGKIFMAEFEGASSLGSRLQLWSAGHRSRSDRDFAFGLP